MHSQAYRAALGACLAACAGSCLAGEECSMHHMRIPTDELIALMLMVLGLTIKPGRGRVPVRCGSIPRLTYRLLQGKKTYTRGPAWSSRSPLTPGDALDIGRGDARYLLRPPSSRSFPPLGWLTPLAGYGHGGTRKSSTSRRGHPRSVSPAAIAGVHGRHTLADPVPLVGRGSVNA